MRIPRRVYEELGGDPAAAGYPSAGVPYADAFETGLIVVDELEHAQSPVSTVMGKSRRFIATETDRDEDVIEKADTALVGLAAQLLASGDADHVVLLTTDKPAGRAAEALLPNHGYDGQIEFRYASVAYLETITAEAFR
ncbi:hypothetical protein [Halovivax limisalsi]|uniref:hypothetical protein n=1 Tax=Halovivax limisalsi TaxID=1453760 RepID=UPI001FFCF4DE|nr:hypothetical protein [Halovivax limisalsi]